MIEDLDTGFPLPQQRTTQNTIDLSPKARNSWLDALPAGNFESAANKILHTLFTINRLAIGNREKLGFLDAIYGTCHAILEELHKRLDDVPAPPSEEEQRRGEFVSRLHYELALAFRCTLTTGATIPPGGNGKSPHDKALPADLQTIALNRAFLHLRGILRTGYQINTPPPAQIWPKIYALFFFARDNDLLDLAASTLPDGEPERVENAFKAIILLYFSTPLSLRSQELGRLCTLLPDLAPHTRLIPVRDARNNCPTYLIGLMTATAPIVEPGSNCADCTQRDSCLEFDVSPLLPRLRKRLRNQSVSTGALVSQDRLLWTLEAHFGPRRGRRPTRIHQEVEVEIIAGLKDVYAFLTPEPEPEAPVQPAPAPDRRERELRRAKDIVAALENPVNPAAYQMVLDLEQARMETRREPPVPFQSFPTPKIVPRRTLCKSMNFSSGGYCLYTERSASFRLHVGELVAVREIPAGRWVAGTIAWLSSARERLQFGVNLLAPQLVAGRAFCSSIDDSQSAECLLLFDTAETHDPSRILLSPRCLAAGHTIHVRHDGREHDLVLTRELSKTHGYVEFSCARPATEEDSEATVPLL